MTNRGTGPLLPDIALPTLIIIAADDPVIPVSVFDDVQFAKSTCLVVTQQGGHMGYLGVSGVDPDRRWQDWRSIDWVVLHDKEEIVTSYRTECRSAAAREER